MLWGQRSSNCWTNLRRKALAELPYLSFQELVFISIVVVVAIVIVAMCTGGGVLGQTTTSLWGGGILVGCKVGHLVVIVVSVVGWHEDVEDVNCSGVGAEF